MIRLFYTCVTALSWLMWIEEAKLTVNHIDSLFTAEEKAMFKAHAKKIDNGLSLLKMFLLSAIPLVHLLILGVQFYILYSKEAETIFLETVEKTVRKAI